MRLNLLLNLMVRVFWECQQVCFRYAILLLWSKHSLTVHKLADILEVQRTHKSQATETST